MNTNNGEFTKVTTDLSQSGSTDEFIELTTNTVDIGSKINIHSCTVSEFLKDLPYDDIPAEIIALITKFYLTKSHTDEEVNSYILSHIPDSFRHFEFQNAIPTTTSRSCCCSAHSLLSIGPILSEIGLLAAVAGLSYLVYLCIVSRENGVFFVLIAAGALLPAFWYYKNVTYHLQDIDRIIAAPISDVDDRILSLNNIFGNDPSIQLYMNCFHSVSRQTSRGSKTSYSTTFRKTVHLKLNNCESVIEPNIYLEAELYRSCCYHFEFEILLHFDDESDRLKYQQLVTQFIVNNIQDDRQTFLAKIRYNMLGLNQWITSGDNHGYVIIVNQKSKSLANILKWIMKICTFLSISWLYKLLFYCLMKRKKLTITKYLSIDKLYENEDY